MKVSLSENDTDSSTLLCARCLAVSEDEGKPFPEAVKTDEGYHDSIAKNATDQNNRDFEDGTGPIKSDFRVSNVATTPGAESAHRRKRLRMTERDDYEANDVDDEPDEEVTLQATNHDKTLTLLETNHQTGTMSEKEARAMRKDVLANESFRTIEATLSKIIFNNISDLKRRSHCLDLLEVLKEKHLGEQDTSLWKLNGTHAHPRSRREFEKRIVGLEEKDRPWMRSMEDKDKFPKLLLRCFDQFSICQIRNPSEGFLSGSSEYILNTRYSRTRALERHIDWRNREKTAFISASSSSKDIENCLVPHMQKRQAKRRIMEYTRLAIINVNAILAKGKPIMRMKDELIHYEVKDKAGNLRYTNRWGESFYEHGYIVPFSITADAIVREWRWSEVKSWIHENGTFAKWIERVGTIAYEEHEKLRLETEAQQLKRQEELKSRQEKSSETHSEHSTTEPSIPANNINTTPQDSFTQEEEHLSDQDCTMSVCYD